MSEKHNLQALDAEKVDNPVVRTSEWAFEAANLVTLNHEGIRLAAEHVRQRLVRESYTPRSWRQHQLHICPPEPYDATNPRNVLVLNWIFLISCLNFSFWSEREGLPDRYGVEWKAGWDSTERKVFTGYWSLVAALDRALEEGTPITDPTFYASEESCPDALIAHVFRAAPQSVESIPLLPERIKVMRETGFILTSAFGGSFKGFLDEFQRRHHGQGSALDLVKMVTETFPCFQDETHYEGRKVYLWKRAQILVAEIWAAFYPPSKAEPHPIFPGTKGPQISHLTMFADYRVPQILHHLQIIDYPSSLLEKLRQKVPFPPGSREEISLRTASIVAVERVREAILQIIKEEGGNDQARDASEAGTISSVLIDFYLWDLAKKLENGEDKIEGIETTEVVPIHRTRSIWY